MQELDVPSKPVKRTRYIQLLIATFLGALVLTIMAAQASFWSFFRGGSDVYSNLFSIIWLGYIVLAIILLFGLNQRFKDPSLSLPIMLWSTLSLLATAFFIDQIRLCFMVLFFITLQTGVFRLRFRSFLGLSLFAIIGYGIVILLVAILHPESMDLGNELIQWAVFSLVALGAVMVASEIASIRIRLAGLNEGLNETMGDIQEMAIRDELTGLFNRRHAIERLEKLRQLANRDAFDFYCLYVDLDHFKRVNDNYGHNVGDEVLRVYARTVSELIGTTDFAARLGGEEFLVILVNTSASEAVAFAEQLKDAIADARYPSAADLSMSASIGVARFLKDEDIDVLLARADQKLYDAKHGGRNQVCLSNEVVL